MDLESESSELAPLEDNEAIVTISSSERKSIGDETKVQGNAYCVVKNNELSFGKGIEVIGSVNLPPVELQQEIFPFLEHRKGCVLKKWRSCSQHSATEDTVNETARSNMVQSGNSLNYDGGNRDELRAGVDPPVDSIYTLQSAQEALGKEVLKFREVGNLLDVSVDGAIQDLPLETISIDLKLQETSSSKQIQSDKNMQSSFHSLHSEAKEAANRKYMGTELEDLFRLKIEAEVESLAISRTVQRLRVAVVDKITPASEQALKLNMLENAENKASMHEKEAEKLANSREDTASADKTLKLQMRIFKYTSYFLIQLVILVLILGFFIFHISPNYGGVVPT